MALRPRSEVPETRSEARATSDRGRSEPRSEAPSSEARSEPRSEQSSRTEARTEPRSLVVRMASTRCAGDDKPRWPEVITAGALADPRAYTRTVIHLIGPTSHRVPDMLRLARYAGLPDSNDSRIPGAVGQELSLKPRGLEVR